MDHLLPYLDILNDKQQEMVDLVIRLCNQNSGTLNLDGLNEVREMLVQQYKSLDGEIKIIDIPPLSTITDEGEPNQQRLGNAIQIIKRGEIRPRILLCIHMDTVYALNDAFQNCRWIDETTLNGPGVADAKGGLVVMLWVLKTLEASPFADKVGWEVIMNSDEELGSPGSVQFLKDRAGQADIGLLFEPTLADGTLISWRKGAGNFDFVVRGRSAHSGREFEKGRNAIVALSKLLVDVDILNTDSDVTYNAGKVSGGRALNMVPEVAVGRVNVRVKTAEQREQVEQQFQRLLDKYNQLDGISVEMFGEFRSAPKVLDDETQQLQQRIEICGQALGIDVKWRGTGGSCDGNKFAAAGLTNIDTLGPQGGNIHSSDEYLLVDSLVPRAKLAALVLLSYASDVA